MAFKRKKLWIFLLLTGVTLIVATWGVLSLDPFGGKISGERLQRIQANPQYQEGAFVNVEPQAPFKFSEAGSFITNQFFYEEIRVPPGEIPVVSVAPSQLERSSVPILKAFWIGHASVYVEIDGLRVLIDPVFSEYASPFDLGPKRFHPPPIALKDLPKIDAVVISHDHYDHLDMKTVKHLGKNGTQFYVPLGVGAHLERWKVSEDQIHELEWWQERVLRGVKIICTPTRHYSGRGLFDYKATLWSSWSVIGPHHRFYYSGDTGYSQHFKEIGDRLGPFDIGFIKVGAYGPGDSWLNIHMDPDQAIRAYMDVQAQRLFPVHWGTFNLAYHDWDEPIQWTLQAAMKENVDVVTPRIGEIVVAKQPFDSQRWWEDMQ